MAASASAATVTRYQASLRSPHNALHSPSMEVLLGERSEPHMGDTSGIFHILLLLYIYYRTYVGVCVTPFFFFFGVRCAQYKVHAQCSFAALAPHMPCMLLVLYEKRTRTCSYGPVNPVVKHVNSIVRGGESPLTDSTSPTFRSP